MSTVPPNDPQGFMTASSSLDMAVAQATKTKPSKAGSNDVPRQKNQMHRRSRTGCYTCRLRRKKCDEGTPMCTACKHLGLTCEYKRPVWWSNNELRRKHKDDIKMIIKRKKLSEKASHSTQTTASSPPGLAHSLPTPATYAEPFDRTRSQSIDSHFAFNFNSSPCSSHEFTSFATPQVQGDFIFPPYSPYDIDVKTERQMYVNDVPTLRESSISTFSAYTTPAPPGVVLPSFPLDGEWNDHVCSESSSDRRESTVTDTTEASFCSSNMFETVTNVPIMPDLDEGDQALLDHFVRFVAPSIFPVLEATHQGSAGADFILPALHNNKAYLHCCLSIAAQHFKATTGLNGGDMDGDIMRHRYATITALCEALNRDEDHGPILEAALGLILFQRGVGRPDDALPDVSWHQHFQAVGSVVQRLELPGLVSEEAAGSVPTQAPFKMSLTAWIDILGATMQGTAPVFADTYREKYHSLANPSLGLRELMGCNDHVMYLISEMACLEALKRDGMDDIQLCQHVHVLGDRIGLTELAEAAAAGLPAPPSPRPPFGPNGSLDPDQLARNLTAAFRLAARIYLCSLVPGFSPRQQSCVGLVDKLAAVLAHVPAGDQGFDRAAVWVWLVGGSVAGPGSALRALFAERVAALGDLADLGSFGRVRCLLEDVWAQNDALDAATLQVQDHVEGSMHEASPPVVGVAGPYVHWRDVMMMKAWDFLLI